MSEQQEQPGGTPGDNAAQSGQTAADGANEQSPQAALDAAREEVNQLRDQALRAQAEMENVRRRAARDVENAHKYGLDKFVAALLPLADSLERAVASSVEANTPEAKAIGEGVQLSLRLFADTLGKFGVEPLDPLGQPFDPQFHQAMSMVDNPEMEPGSVMQVFQKGYSLNGRLVRPAMVVVTKGGSSTPPKVDERV